MILCTARSIPAIARPPRRRGAVTTSNGLGNGYHNLLSDQVSSSDAPTVTTDAGGSAKQDRFWRQRDAKFLHLPADRSVRQCAS